MKDSNEWLKERLRHIVVATDFGKPSYSALGYACGLAQRYGSDLALLNVFQFGPYSHTVEVIDHVPSRERRTAEEMLRDFVSEAGTAAAGAKQIVVEGMVPSEILRTLAADGVDLLVISPERVHRGFDHFLLGSHSEALMLGSPCPILTLGPQVPERREAHTTCQKVIYICDLSNSSATAAIFANEIGRSFGAELEIYPVFPNVTRHETLEPEDAADRYTQTLKRFDIGLPVDWYSPEFLTSQLYTEPQIAEKTMERSNLIVLGTKSESFLQRHLHTSLAYRILANAASPVLSIPEKLSPHLSAILPLTA